MRKRAPGTLRFHVLLPFAATFYLCGCHGSSDDAAHHITVHAATRSPDGAHIAVAFSDRVDGPGDRCWICVDAFPLAKPFKDSAASCQASQRAFRCDDIPRLTWRDATEVIAVVRGLPAIEPMVALAGASTEPSIHIVYRRAGAPAPSAPAPNAPAPTASP